MALLYIFSGLPGVGKTTLAMLLSRHVEAAYIRIDTIEQALRDLTGIDVQAEGYEMAYRIAGDTLELGGDVVADCCNPIELTRSEWKRVAARANTPCLNIEVICSDRVEHRRRAEARPATIERLTPPTWEEIEARVYDQWQECRIVIDTAGSSEAESFADLLCKIAESRQE